MDNLRIELRYAILISLLTLLWLSFEFMVGLHDVYIQYQFIASCLSLLIPVVCIRMAIAEKAEQLNGSIGFKQALVTGFLIAFFSAVMAIPVQVLFHKLINPDYFDNMVTFTVNIQKVKDPQEAEMYINLTTAIIRAGLVNLVFGAVVATFTAWMMKTDK